MSASHPTLGDRTKNTSLESRLTMDMAVAFWSGAARSRKCLCKMGIRTPRIHCNPMIHKKLKGDSVRLIDQTVMHKTTGVAIRMPRAPILC